MFEELNHRLGWTLDSLPRSKIVLITSDDVEGGFLLHHFISMYVKQKHPVCLVTLAQSYPHYVQAGLKMSSNLEKAKLEARLCHLDLMSIFLKSYLKTESSGKINENLLRVIQNPDTELKNIYLSIRSSLLELASKNANCDGPSLLVIDDISTLMSIGFSISALADFIHYLHVLCTSQNVLLVTVMPVMIEGDCRILLKILTYYSDTVISVKGLSSGYCKDVHGDLHLTKKDNRLCNSVWQYKLSDKNLNIFAKGTSAAVL